MEIKNSFEVPLPPAEAWKVLMDIPRIAPCMPGAELVEAIDGQTYKGKISVKLGPIALTFNGTAEFEEKDEQSHTARVKAQGGDTKGRGGANAKVSFKLAPVSGGSRVDVLTDVTLSGLVAQYGRGTGIIQGVATQLINQFATSLRAMLAKEGVMQREGSAGESSGLASQTSAVAPSPIDTAAPAQAKPISGFSLMVSVIWSAITGLFRRKD